MTPTAVAQEGIRVRAAAGAASYRRPDRLERLLAQVDAQIGALKDELDADPDASSRRVATPGNARREKGPIASPPRIVPPPAIEATKKRNAKGPASRGCQGLHDRSGASHYEDGRRWGWRPAYNAGLVTDAARASLDRTGLRPATTREQLGPMVRHPVGRHGASPDAWPADAGFPRNFEIEEFTTPGSSNIVHLPVLPAYRSRDPYQPHPLGSPAVAAWRIRIGTPAAKELNMDRAATAEFVRCRSPATVVSSALSDHTPTEPRQLTEIVAQVARVLDRRQAVRDGRATDGLDRPAGNRPTALPLSPLS